MEVRFATRQLERRYRSRTEAIRAWGPVVGNRYVERIGFLVRAPALADVYEARSLSDPPTGRESRRPARHQPDRADAPDRDCAEQRRCARGGRRRLS